MCQDLGTGEIPLNKLGLVSKERSDGTFKHRLIWDLKRSGVNDFVNQGQQIVLPRLSDVVSDGLELLALCEHGDEVELCIIDFQDAFHSIPVK